MAIKIEDVRVRVNKHEAVEEVLITSESPRFSFPLYFDKEEERNQFKSGATYRMEFVQVEAPPPEGTMIPTEAAAMAPAPAKGKK